MKSLHKTVMFTARVVSFLLLVSASLSLAQDKTRVSFETDPSTFLLKGYAFHVRVQPAGISHVVVGAGTYALDMPGVMVDMNQKNKGKGWTSRIAGAYSLFGEYYFNEANQSWYLGLQAGVQNYRIQNSRFPNQESTYSNLLLMPSLGYNWRPFTIPLYVKPWMGIGYTRKISGSATIGTTEYDIAPVIPFLTVHVGYYL